MKRRTTFGKRQRELDKQAKLAAKRERRLGQDDPPAPAPAPTADRGDEQAVLAELAELHERYRDEAIDLEEFQLRRDELSRRLTVD